MSSIGIGPDGNTKDLVENKEGETDLEELKKQLKHEKETNKGLEEIKKIQTAKIRQLSKQLRGHKQCSTTLEATFHEEVECNRRLQTEVDEVTTENINLSCTNARLVIECETLKQELQWNEDGEKEKSVQVEQLREKLQIVEKDNNNLKRYVREYERLTAFDGYTDTNDTRNESALSDSGREERDSLLERELTRLDIDESAENLVENYYRNEEKVVSLNASCKKMKDYNDFLQRENKMLNTENKGLEEEIKMLKRKLERDHEDGTHGVEGSENYNQEKPIKMEGFRNHYNCPVSCVSSVVSFIFYTMGLPLCNKRFDQEVQVTLSSLSEATGEVYEVGNCSLAFQDFRDVSLIEGQPLLFKKIKDAAERGRFLQDAVETIKQETYPALFRMHYEGKQAGTKRTGHCVAIMPNGNVIDVQQERYWVPEKDPHWESVNLIEVWRVEKDAAEEWEGRCGLKKCGRECVIYTSDHYGGLDTLN